MIPGNHFMILFRLVNLNRSFQIWCCNLPAWKSNICHRLGKVFCTTYCVRWWQIRPKLEKRFNASLGIKINCSFQSNWAGHQWKSSTFHYAHFLVAQDIVFQHPKISKTSPRKFLVGTVLESILKTQIMLLCSKAHLSISSGRKNFTKLCWRIFQGTFI